MSLLRYWSKGKWNRTKYVFSNVSFTANIVLHRRPEYYVSSLKPWKWSIQLFSYCKCILFTYSFCVHSRFSTCWSRCCSWRSRELLRCSFRFKVKRDSTWCSQSCLLLSFCRPSSPQWAPRRLRHHMFVINVDSVKYIFSLLPKMYLIHCAFTAGS